MTDRIKRLNELFNEEFSSLSQQYYNENSQKYPNRYTPVGRTHYDVNLFEEIEKYIQNEYQIPFKLNKHFDFHSERVFFCPTDNFGFTSKLKNCDELTSQFPEYKRGKYYYSIFENLYPNKKLSKVIQSKINSDVELEAQLIKNELKAYFKRFFILGGYNLFWISIDQLNHFGIDKFPDCLNSEIKGADYDIKFHLSMNGVGQSYDEYGIPISDKIQKQQAEKEKKYFLYLKEKGVEHINYRDILLDPHIQNEMNFNEEGFGIWAKYEKNKNVQILKIRSNQFKLYRSQEFRNKVLERRRNSNEYIIIDYNNIEFTPFHFPKNFKLEPDDVITDDSLLNEYLQSYNEPENEIRELFGLPKIGEGWISETNLYYELKKHFSDKLVIQHGRPGWLGKQHIDIYFPKHGIAVEYQGDQHYFPVDFFGGEEAFKKNKLRDERKRVLCKENNCDLIYVKPDYKIDEVIDQIENMLKK